MFQVALVALSLFVSYPQHPVSYPPDTVPQRVQPAPQTPAPWVLAKKPKCDFERCIAYCEDKYVADAHNKEICFTYCTGLKSCK
jgi:hypothetical protein